jgi:hypothetical protein
MKEKCKNCGNEFDETEFMQFLCSMKKKMVLNDLGLDEIVTMEFCSVCKAKILSDCVYRKKPCAFPKKKNLKKIDALC